MLDWQLLIIVIRGIIWRRSDLVRANKKNKKKRRKKNWWKLDLVQKVEKKQRFIHWITCSWIKILQFGSQIAVTNRNYSIISAREKYRMSRTEMAELLRLSCHREVRTITLDTRSRIISIHFMESKGRLTALSVVLDVKDLEPSSFETKFYIIR